MSISSSDGEAPLPMVVRKSSHPPAASLGAIKLCLAPLPAL